MKKMKLLFSLLTIVLFSACTKHYDEGPMTTQTRNVPEFHSVSTSGSHQVLFVYDTLNTNISIQAGSNLIPYITTDVQNGILYIEEEPNNIRNNKLVKITVPVNEINGLYFLGSGTCSGGPIFSPNGLTLGLYGSGAVNLNVNTSSSQIETDGSGSLSLHGFSPICNLNATGSGQFNGRNLITEHSVISLSGSGQVEVYATENLEALLTGSGSIRYWGHPNNTSFQITGSGSIIQMD